MLVSLLCVCRCVFLLGGNGGGRAQGDLNLTNLTSEWDSNPQPHEYQSDALTTELSGDLYNRA